MSDMQSYFHNFIEKISIEKTDLGSKITEWKECLEGKLAIDFVRKSGSTKRGTSLNSSDVDLIVVFEKGKVDTSIPVEFFATTEGNIRNCFGKIRQMDHGFVYEEIPGTSIDIVTAYTEKENPFVFWIPDKRNGRFVWIKTSPEASEKRIEDANGLTSGRAGKYVRLMKYWNTFRNKVFNSFYLEVLVVKKILTDSEKFNKFIFPEGLLYLFEYLLEAVDHKEPQPSRKGPHLGDLTQNERERIKSSLKYAIRMAKLALKPECHLNNQRIYWENIFGYELTK